MNNVSIYGNEDDLLSLESAFKEAGIAFDRKEKFGRTFNGNSTTIIAISSAVIGAVAQVLCAVAKHRKKKASFTLGHGELLFENYSVEELAKILPTVKSRYIEDAPATQKITKKIKK